jgi:methyl-accepting chemotaxis protein
LDENLASVEEIAEKVEEIVSMLAQCTVPTTFGLTSTSASKEISDRVEAFNAYVQSWLHLRSH